jgi:hypothetical protein
MIQGGLTSLTSYNRASFERRFTELASFFGDRENDTRRILESVYADPDITDDGNNLEWLKINNAVSLSIFLPLRTAHELDSKTNFRRFLPKESFTEKNLSRFEDKTWR